MPSTGKPARQIPVRPSQVSVPLHGLPSSQSGSALQQPGMPTAHVAASTGDRAVTARAVRAMARRTPNTMPDYSRHLGRPHEISPCASAGQDTACTLPCGAVGERRRSEVGTPTLRVPLTSLLLAALVAIASLPAPVRADAPPLASASPRARKVRLRVGERQRFAAPAVGGEARCSWRLDGQTIPGMALTWDFVPTPAHMGAHRVTLRLDGPAGAAERWWAVRVEPPRPPRVEVASPAATDAAAAAADAAAPAAAAASPAADAAATPADDGSAAPAHDRPGAPDDHPAGAPADDLAAPHHDPTGAPVSAAAHTDDHAGSTESHPDHRAHRRARGAPDERTARGPGRPPADAAAAGGERPAVARARAASPARRDHHLGNRRPASALRQGVARALRGGAASHRPGRQRGAGRRPTGLLRPGRGPRRGGPAPRGAAAGRPPHGPLHAPRPVPRPARPPGHPGDGGPEGHRAHGERPPLRPVGAVRSRRGWAPRALGGPPETSSPIAASKAANGNARRRPSLGPRARRGRWHPAPGAHPVDRRRAHPQAVLPHRRRPLAPRDDPRAHRAARAAGPDPRDRGCRAPLAGSPAARRHSHIERVCSREIWIPGPGCW